MWILLDVDCDFVSTICEYDSVIPIIRKTIYCQLLRAYPKSR
jgi:hypothetical protein